MHQKKFKNELDITDKVKNWILLSESLFIAYFLILVYYTLINAN